MKGVKLKQIYLNEDEILFSPPTSTGLAIASQKAYAHCRLVEDLDEARELIRGRKLKKQTSQKESDNELVQKLNEFKATPGLRKLNNTAFMRRNTIRHFNTIRNFDHPLPQTAYQPTNLRTKSQPVDNMLRVGLGKGMKAEMRKIKDIDSERNQRYEKLQKDKYNQLETNLNVDRRIVSEINAEISRVKTKLETTIGNYNTEIKELYMSEARVVHNRNQSKGSIGEEGKYMFEREKIRKVIQDKHQEHFKDKRKMERELEDLQGKHHEALTHKRLLKKAAQEIRRNLVALYLNILKDGIDTRRQNIRWVIKALWKMGEPIPITAFPKFLDDDSVYFLMLVAKKELESEKLDNKLRKAKDYLRSHRNHSPVKTKTNELWRDVKSRIRELSKSVVMGHSPSPDATVKENSFELDHDRTRAHQRLQFCKKRMSEISQEIGVLSDKEVKRISADYKPSENIPELPVIIDCLVGYKSK